MKSFFEIEYYDHFGIDGYCLAVTRLDTFNELFAFYDDLKARGGKIISVYCYNE